MDAGTGRILEESNADGYRYPASLTKMMTLYLVFESLDNGLLRLDDRLPISEHAASQPPTKIGLKPGQTITVENAILALVTKSANDIAAAIGESLGGSEPQFAGMMTRKAHELGMVNTTFQNASGLPDPAQMTTARDMGILGLALVHDFPHYYPYFSTERFYYGGAVHPNHNHLLGAYEGLDGIKTGYTQAAGFNLVASAQRDGRRLIGVVMGARSPGNRSVMMTSLLDQAFAGQEVIEVRDSSPSAPMLARQERAPAAASWSAGRTIGATPRPEVMRSLAMRPDRRSPSLAKQAQRTSQADRKVAAAARPAPAARAGRTAAPQTLAAAAPKRGAAQNAQKQQKGQPVRIAMATPKPAAKAAASAKVASAAPAAASAKKAKPQVVSDVKPKAKTAARHSQADGSSNKRVLASSR